MRTLLSCEPGGPETLELTELPDPAAGPGQLLVKVKACAINYPDVLIIEDRYQFKPPRPFAPGGEIAGVVEQVGEGVTGWAPGDRMIAMLGHGGLAEKVLVQAPMALPLPPERSFEDGSALILTYATSIHALLDRGRLQAGQTLLVLGAAGGVGLAAVELGKAFGARVVGAVSSEEKAEAVRAAGADHVIVYPQGPFDKGRVKGACRVVQGGCGRAGRGRDLRSRRRRLCRARLARHRLGRPLPGGRLPGWHPQAAAQPHLAEELRRLRRLLGRVRRTRPAGQRGPYPDFVQALGRGQDRAKGEPDLAAGAGGEAIAYMAARKAVGKLVVTMND
jgi:hypothetical protein